MRVVLLRDKVDSSLPSAREPCRSPSGGPGSSRSGRIVGNNLIPWELYKYGRFSAADSSFWPDSTGRSGEGSRDTRSLSSPRGRAFSRVPPSGPSTADWEVTCPVLVHHEWLPRQGSLPDTGMSVTQFGGQDHPGEGFRLLEGFALSFTPERALLLVPAVRRLFGPLPRRRSRD